MKGILPHMVSIADGWWNEDRRDLLRSLQAITATAPNAHRIGLCLDTILNDLELYDDPRQGAGIWLYDNELQLAERLGEKLREVAGDTRLVEAGPAAIVSGVWPEAQSTARHLLRLMEANGDFVG
jgi:hypothetical protein